MVCVAMFRFKTYNCEALQETVNIWRPRCTTNIAPFFLVYDEPSFLGKKKCTRPIFMMLYMVS